MPKRIDPNTLTETVGTFYPSPYDKPCRARARKRLGDAAGLTQYGVNLLRLPPGVWSSQRHWHTEQDEFVYVVSGEVVLVTDAGEEILRTGDCAGFKAGDKDGHHLQTVGPPMPCCWRSEHAQPMTRENIPTSTWRSKWAQHPVTPVRTARRTPISGGAGRMTISYCGS